MTRSRPIVIILTTLAIAAIASLIHWPEPLTRALGPDAYKLFLQFSLVTVVGGLVSAVFAELKRESESREARRQSLRSFHTTALSAYNRAKKLRRLITVLVPHNVNGTTYLRKKEYQALMTDLEDVQLEIESMKRQVGVAHDLFAAAKEVEELLRSMEKYLRLVLKEFEQAPFDDEAAEFKLSDFPQLRAFIDDTDQPDGFVAKLSSPYDDVEAILLKLTLR
jgi:hypothetical protein